MSLRPRETTKESDEKDYAGAHDDLARMAKEMGAQEGGDDNSAMGEPADPGEEPPDKPDEKVILDEKNLKHIFRTKTGHLRDTPENRKLLLEATNNRKNYIGMDSHGNRWYAVNTSDGKQVWAQVRGNLLRNGGVNEHPRTHAEILKQAGTR